MQYTMQALKTKPKDMWAAHWEGKDQHALVTASSSPGNEIVSTENIQLSADRLSAIPLISDSDYQRFRLSADRLSADRLSAIPLISDSDYRPTDYQRFRLSAIPIIGRPIISDSDYQRIFSYFQTPRYPADSRKFSEI